MHELSIVMSIVDIATREAAREGATVIEEIELEIGRLSTIEPDALEFAWQQGVKATPLAHARKVIHYIDGQGNCPDCGISFPVKELFDACPVCGEHLIEITRGKELRVRSLIVS